MAGKKQATKKSQAKPKRKPAKTGGGAFTKSAHFEWTASASAVAIALAEGKTKEEAAEAGSVSRRTVYNWLVVPEFAEEVDRLTLMVGIAGRAERLRIAKRVVAQKCNGGLAVTDKDLLDWLKFAQSETDGIKLDMAKLAAFTEDEAPLADSRQGGVSTVEESYTH